MREAGVSLEMNIDNKFNSKGLMCGYLHKLGGSGMTWQKRFLVLDPPNLLYYKSSDMKKLKGVLRLDGCTCR